MQSSTAKQHKLRTPHYFDSGYNNLFGIQMHLKLVSFKSNLNYVIFATALLLCDPEIPKRILPLSKNAMHLQLQNKLIFYYITW